MSVSSEPLYIGVDVGTGSVRAALVGKDGALLSTSSQEIRTWRSPADHRIYEQSTTDIWDKICVSVKQCLDGAAESGQLSADQIAARVRGIGFDATCSLAVTDSDGRGLTVTQGSALGGRGERNVILWADHRAEKEAAVINATGSSVLDYVGGKISLEMEVPKILWLKNNMQPERFSRCRFFDLPDYLTYRATGDTARSTCSLTCKCSSGWDDAFFERIGLGELVERGYEQVGAEEPLTAGMPVGRGLSADAAGELGLAVGTPVGSAIIDAYAGWLGTVGARCEMDSSNPGLDNVKHRLALVAGTSTCHIVQSPDGVFVDGIWGPYKDPILPGWWMNEGGQSSTGQLIEHIITTHPAHHELLEQAKASGTDIYEVLHRKLEELRTESKVASYTELTKDLNMYPDFHGNRSPIADPRMRGSIVGLDLDISLASLAKLYFATLTAIALQTRSIIDTLNAKGHEINQIYVSGSQAKNPVLMKLLADACHGETGAVKGVVVSASEGKQTGVSAVVLGAAMLGRLAHEVSSSSVVGDRDVASSLWAIMLEMTPLGVFIPASDDEASVKERRILEVKYKIFLESLDSQRRWRSMLEAVV